MKKNLFFLLFAFLSTGLFAHGDLGERIKAVSKEIKNQPDSAYLYFKRGLLYFQHEDYQDALKDYSDAELLGYSDIALTVNMAAAWYGLRDYNKALVYLEEVLSRENNHLPAWRIKGETLLAMEKYEEAADAFENAIAFEPKREPELYLQAAFAWEKTGTETGNTQAIAILKTGLQQLGTMVTFYQRIIELHIQNQHFDQALYYHDLIIAQSNRKEAPYYNRALTYLLKGERDKARTDLEAAKQSIALLHERQQKTKAIKKLTADITQQLEQL
jgi:tetratricopeptide (TPR) repeat protein